MEKKMQTQPSSEAPGREMMSPAPPPVPPQEREFKDDSKLAGQHSPLQDDPDEAFADGEEVTSVGRKLDAEKEELKNAEPEVSASVSGDKQCQSGELNKQEEEESATGQEVTSVGQTTDAEEAELMKEEVDPEVSTAASGEEQGQPEELNQQEEEEADEEEEEGSDALQSQNSPAPGVASHRSRGRSSRSKCPAVSKYNTVCYRKIKKGNTRQRVDEFESMMSV
ncbi:uncharacterized protein ermn [Brachyhypopomus gauderio]|uniref:uncharacterized protein ermn n=1 Tax=Brachyhypopomus gauderio TaxID=698409 RepID=UPI00404109ED